MLKLAILEVLLICHTAQRMMTKSLLRKECEMRAGGKIGDTEFDTTFAELIDGRFIDSVKNNLTGDDKYFITDLGRAQL